MNPSIARRLIVNADDFGRSESINQAIVRAHRQGILTTTSLMVNESAADQAVALARDNPRLGVGLHLTFLCGHSALLQGQIPGLVNLRQEFTDNPTAAGFRYFFTPGLRAQLRAEIHAQFAKFHATGLPLDHVNGHLHLHLHPAIFRILMQDAPQLRFQRVRLTFDPFWLNLRLASGYLAYRTLHAAIFHCLSARSRPVLHRAGFRHTQAVFGLLQNARVDERYVMRLLPRLPPGDSELYSHPSLDEFSHEFDALISPRVQDEVKRLGIQLIRYQDL
ncbi:MAG TPA: hopanoid biosynthesis-associated protein HpnK [Verrucomicrobiae bacterium]|nr:hopanoid biosynthesis-associated protein HpnK [Verrucomicrobiae bacterium]